MINANAQVLKLERAGALDKYGRSRLETIANRFWVRLDPTSSHARRPDGDYLTIDAEVVTDARYELRPKDILTFDALGLPKYTVYDVTPSLDVHGKVEDYAARLVKIEDT